MSKKSFMSKTQMLILRWFNLQLIIARAVAEAQQKKKMFVTRKNYLNLTPPAWSLNESERSGSNGNPTNSFFSDNWVVHQSLDYPRRDAPFWTSSVFDTIFVSSVDIGSVNLLRVHSYLMFTLFLLRFRHNIRNKFFRNHSQHISYRSNLLPLPVRQKMIFPTKNYLLNIWCE